EIVVAAPAPQLVLAVAAHQNVRGRTAVEVVDRRARAVPRHEVRAAGAVHLVRARAGVHGVGRAGVRTCVAVGDDVVVIAERRTGGVDRVTGEDGVVPGPGRHVVTTRTAVRGDALGQVVVVVRVHGGEWAVRRDADDVVAAAAPDVVPAET